MGQGAALAKHDNLVAQLECLVDVVGDHHNRLGDVGLQTEELVLQLTSHDRVDGAERFVHQQERRVGRKRARHPDALLLSAGELPGVPLREFGVKADTLEEFHCRRTGFLLTAAEQPWQRGHVVHDGAVGEQAGVLDDVADSPAQRHAVE